MELRQGLQQKYTKMQDSKEAKTMLKQILDIDEELNECIVQKLQRDGEIFPALKVYSLDATDKINKEFNENMKKIETKNKEIKQNFSKLQESILGKDNEFAYNQAPKRIDIVSSINNGSFVHYKMQEEFLKKERNLKQEKQDSSTSADSDKLPENFVWTEEHGSKFEEYMTKFENSSMETIQ